jgi:hypothetical protein
VGTGDIYGCDPEEPSRSAILGSGSTAGAQADTPLIQDEESAAIAREAAAKHVPFIVFRAVSDGHGDPLDLPGFPAQFNVYYRLAANNAAAVAEASRQAALGNCATRSALRPSRPRSQPLPICSVVIGSAGRERGRLRPQLAQLCIDALRRRRALDRRARHVALRRLRRASDRPLDFAHRLAAGAAPSGVRILRGTGPIRRRR